MIVGGDTGLNDIISSGGQSLSDNSSRAVHEGRNLV